MLGRVVSKETKAKIAKANIGKKHSAETKAKLSVIAKEFYYNNPNCALHKQNHQYK